ncbi:MAG: ATP-binding cassette domain-containing protein, partial [Spirochaetales bacterium]|nr:ATP-binding cassette domain-containing protein [Spirochaetales bacterium]
MNNIVKTFPGVKALRGVELKVKPGEIHALMGENGAGKSTLVNCIAGIHGPTSV